MLQPRGSGPCSETLKKIANMMNDKAEGDHILTGDERINGMIVDPFTVPTGVHCEMNGTVTSDIFAEAGATVEINGTVGGNLISTGATIDVRGFLSGAIIDRSDT